MTNKIIGISGKKRHGKDTVGNIIQAQRPTAVKIAYADALKREVAEMIVSYVETNPKQWAGGVLYDEKLIQDYIGQMNDDTIDPFTGVSVKEKFRLILQWWGTEFRRQMFGDDYWRRKLAERVGQLEPDQLAVITDVRFPDEADQIKAMGGILVRVNRPGMDSSSTHPSETALDNYGQVSLYPGSDQVLGTLMEHLPVMTTNDWDVVMENDGTLGDLEMKVTEVLQAYGY